VAGGGRAQLATDPGERGHPLGVGGGTVAAQQPVQRDARREVLQDDEPGLRSAASTRGARASPRSSVRKRSAAASVRMRQSGVRARAGWSRTHLTTTSRGTSAGPVSRARATVQGASRDQEETVTGTP
jgi:hypothetical protein